MYLADTPAGREAIAMFIWRPARDPLVRNLEKLRREMDSLAGMFTGGGKPWTRSPWRESRLFPLLNVWETTDAYTVTTEIPGIRIEDLEIQLHGDTLIVKGERQAEESGEEVSYHVRERACGPFQRSLILPRNVDGERVRARYRKGVLAVTLPKQKEKAPTQIQISAQ
jgi:HSP20 family protein